MNKIKILFVVLGMCLAIPNMSALSKNDSIKIQEGIVAENGDFIKSWSFEMKEQKARAIFNSKIFSKIEVKQKNNDVLNYFAYVKFEGDVLGFYLNEEEIDDILNGLNKLKAQLELDMNTTMLIENKYNSISGVKVCYSVKKAKFDWKIGHELPYVSTYTLRDDFDLIAFFSDLKTRIADAKTQMAQ